MNDNNWKYHVFKDYEIPFDEKNNNIGTVRLVQWIKGDDEIDESKAKIEIRKIINKNGEETFGKGYTFSTPEGPSELVHGLIGAGFGETKQILKGIKDRDDFGEAVRTIDFDDEGSDDGETFDMRDLLLNMSGDNYTTDDSDDDE